MGENFYKFWKNYFLKTLTRIKDLFFLNKTDFNKKIEDGQIEVIFENIN